MKDKTQKVLAEKHELVIVIASKVCEGCRFMIRHVFGGSIGPTTTPQRSKV